MELQCFSCMGDCTGGGRLCKKIARKSKKIGESINYRSHNLSEHPRGMDTSSTHDRSCQNILKLSLVSDYSFDEVLHDMYSAHFVFECLIYLLPFIFSNYVY